MHPCKQACLTEPPHPSGLPLADGKPQNKIAAVGSTKRLRWSHNDILCLVECSLSCGVLPSRQQSCVCRLPGTPPPSVYQVTHGTALTLLNLGCTRHSSSQLGSALICTRFQAAFVVGYLYPRALPPVTHGSAFQAPECLRDTIRGRILSRGQDVYPCLSPCDGCKDPKG